MKTWLRKLRGIVSIGALWGLACSVLGLGLGVIASILSPQGMPSTVVRYMVSFALQYGIVGFVLGSGFAGVLATMHARKTFKELTAGRGALWGGLTGVGMSTVLGLIWIGLLVGSGYELPGLISVSVVMTGICGAVTAGLGAGTVSLARRAPAELEAGTVLHESLPLGDPDESTTLQIGSD